MSRDLLTSPVGSIVFMAAENPIKETSGKEVYTIKLAFDLKKDKEFLDAVSAINDTKVVTERSYRGKSDAVKEILSKGKAMISASTKFKPKVCDAEGNELEEAPSFFSDSQGTAKMIVQPYEGVKGGTINLMAIIIQSIETPTDSSGDSRETRLAALKEAVKQAVKD